MIEESKRLLWQGPKAKHCCLISGFRSNYSKNHMLSNSFVA